MRKRLPRLSTVVFLLLFIVVILIDVPSEKKVKFSVGPYKIDTVINPLRIDTEIFGMPIHKEFETKLGLDLKGGSHLLFEADISKIAAKDREDALESARNIIETRINYFGVTEPNIQTISSGKSRRISVDLAGVEDVQQAVDLIGQTAQLIFVEESTASAKISTQESQLERLTQVTPLTGKHVKKATVQFGSSSGAKGGPSVGLEFNKDGAKLFEEITGRNIGKPLGIVIDNQMISAPTVQTKISGGQAVITGNFSVDEAKNLAVAINSGALPVPIKLIEQRNVGPSLGQEAVERSILAGIIGLSSVVLFMILTYGRLGIIAVAALIIYGLISFAVFRAIPVVLTLPGVAGFILSIGMAVDANILIFERIKEETRRGKNFDAALRLGFGKAIDAIKDANIATIIVAFILFNPLNWEVFPQFGLIRGFALTLLIGVVTSLFTGVVVTKRLIYTFYKRLSKGTS